MCFSITEHILLCILSVCSLYFIHIDEQSLFLFGVEID